MLHSLLTHLAAHWKVEIGIPSVFIALGLFLHDATQPKVIAVMVFLADWNMLWTWEWWLRMFISIVFCIGVWWFQRRKNHEQLVAKDVEWQGIVKSLRDELKHKELLVSSLQTRVAVLEGRRK